MSVRAITPNGIKKKKKNNFRKLFLLVDSFFDSSRYKKEEEDGDDNDYDEWVNEGGTWGTMRVYIKSEKRSFSPSLYSAQRKEDSFLLCIKFTRIMVITLLTLYLTPPPPFLLLRPRCRYICVRERKAQFLVVSWAFKGETLSDGEGSLLRLRWTFTQPSQLSSVNIYSHFHRGEHFIKISTIFSLRS